MRSYTEQSYQRVVEAQKRGRQTQKRKAEERRKTYYLSPKHCQICDKVIPYEKRKSLNCSMSCAATARNKGVRRHGNPGESINCLVCGEKTKPGRKYCSQSCSGSSNKFDIESWLKGEISGGTVLGCSVGIKRYLLEQCNHKCPKCGWGEIHPVTGKVPLEVNHIDGDSTNNTQENLEILCPNCHSLTPNFRALNKNSKRKHR